MFELIATVIEIMLLSSDTGQPLYKSIAALTVSLDALLAVNVISQVLSFKSTIPNLYHLASPAFNWISVPQVYSTAVSQPSTRVGGVGLPPIVIYA